jgi:hypothetical protein
MDVWLENGMNNEPVAWHYPGGSPDQCTTNKEYAEMHPAWTPLYAHPAKTLTDDEIKEVWMNRPANTAEGVIDFARAILKKAQEK